MLTKIVDLHIHSRYSRACSPDLELPKIAEACVTKGIDICATGDFTHPAWIKHIKDSLEEINNSGLYKLRTDIDPSTSLRMTISETKTVGDVRFILSTEISCIYKHKDKTRRLHLVILAPSIASVEKFNDELTKRGVNIKSDGRPIMGLSAKIVLQILLDIDPRFMMIPAHAWTPWFAIFGSKSGYDSIEECFEELTPHIRAIETGLSSDPVMNHRLSALDNITLVSNSDAHSLANLGREANVLSFTDEDDVNFDELTRIIREGDKKKFLYTIEFYPEEGKYHVDGHAVCNVCMLPKEAKQNKNICPVCKKGLTVGVLHRVDDLADRDEKQIPTNKFIPHKYIVPLREIIARAIGVGVGSKKVQTEYNSLIKHLGNEFDILLNVDLKEIEKCVGLPAVASGITNVRSGNVRVKPGYDGIFGVVDVVGEIKKINQSRLL